MLKDTVVLVIPCRTVNRKLDSMKMIPVFFDNLSHSGSNNCGRIFECAAAISTKNYDIIAFLSCNVQDPAHSLDMELI